MANNGTDFWLSFFPFGHTLIIRMSGLSSFGLAIQTIQLRKDFNFSGALSCGNDGIERI